MTAKACDLCGERVWGRRKRHSYCLFVQRHSSRLTVKKGGKSRVVKEGDKRRGRPSHRKIVEAQGLILQRLGIDPSVAATQCWACGADGKPVRAHIEPFNDTKNCDPTGFFLLCEICHREQPDQLPRSTQLAWIENSEGQLSRIERLVRPVLQVIRERAEPGQMEEFAKHMGCDVSEKVSDYLQGRPLASHRYGNMTASMAWSLLAMFEDWRSEVAPT